jgi:hypothetical protein
MKTIEERTAEVAALKEIKPKIRHRSAFCDDHHEAIDAQVDVIHDRMSEDDIYAAWGDEDIDEFAQNVLDAALEAHEWMMGRSSTAPAPHTGWLELAQ